MSEPAVLIEKKNHICTVTINRPDKKNSINPEVLVRLSDAWKDCNEDKETRVVILTGAGDSFCAGADIGKLIGKLTKPNATPEDEWEERVMKDSSIIFRGLLKDPNAYLYKPLIAAVEGAAVAGGTEVLLGTDIRVASRSAFFGLAEAKWSFFPLGGSAVRLRRQIPYTKAAEILFTGAQFSAEEALAFGLVGHVVDTGKALDKAREIAEVIAGNGPLAVQAIKRALFDTECLREAEAFGKEMQLGVPVFMSKDSREGQKAFAEKRKPVYKGE